MLATGWCLSSNGDWFDPVIHHFWNAGTWLLCIWWPIVTCHLNLSYIYVCIFRLAIDNLEFKLSCRTHMHSLLQTYSYNVDLRISAFDMNLLDSCVCWCLIACIFSFRNVTRYKAELVSPSVGTAEVLISFFVPLSPLVLVYQDNIGSSCWEVVLRTKECVFPAKAVLIRGVVTGRLDPDSVWTGTRISSN